jgi:hypothetical protein
VQFVWWTGWKRDDVVESLFTFILARKPGGAPDVSSSTSNTLNSESPVDDDPSIRFYRRLTMTSSVPGSLLELVAVAVPSSEGWEDVDDILWFYGFSCREQKDGADKKILFIRFPTTAGWDSADLTASLCALIELGQDALDCDELFLAVKRNPEELNNLVHTLMYVGFEVDSPPFPYDDNHYLTLKLETE